MRRARILILSVAAVSAIALAFMVRAMLSRPAPQPTVIAAAPAGDAKPMAKVLVAKRDLPVGSRLSEADLQWQPWPADAVNSSFVTDGSVAMPAPAVETTGDKAAEAVKVATSAAQEMLSGDGAMQAVVGAVVKEAILANEPITDRKLVRSGETGYMAVVLTPGMRAIAIPVSVESAAGGFILPGDRVDLIQSKQLQGPGGAAAGAVADTVMTNVRVLAIDQSTTVADGAQAVVGAVATLEVTPGDAEAIAQARKEGELTLSLRSYADINGPSGRRARERVASSAGGVRVWRSGQPAVAAMN